MRRPRLTIRSLMIAVAAVAILIYGDQLRRRRDHFLLRASEYRSLELENLDGAKWLSSVADETEKMPDRRTMQLDGHQHTLSPEGKEPFWKGPEDALTFFQRSADSATRHGAYFGELRRKYERFARYPWLRCEPDPPAPPLPK